MTSKAPKSSAKHLGRLRLLTVMLCALLAGSAVAYAAANGGGGHDDGRRCKPGARCLSEHMSLRKRAALGLGQIAAHPVENAIGAARIIVAGNGQGTGDGSGGSAGAGAGTEDEGEVATTAGGGGGAPVEEPPPAESPTEAPPVVIPEPSPEAEPTPVVGCPLAPTTTTGPIALSMPGCEEVASDTAAEADPIPFWSSIQCAESSRYSYGASGGDAYPTATGASQGNSAYRKLTVLDGDNFSGERCELGENDHRFSHTAFYEEGDHLVTYFSERLPANFPLATNDWQTVMQMKQAQPSDNGGGAPILEMEARSNRWVVVDNWHELWSFPAQSEKWTRFAWDVYYSNIPGKGWLKVSVDLNGDGDFNDPGERSPVFHVATLKTEIEGPNGASDGLVAGDPIPSHLRIGIYHDPAIPCPAPTGCSVEVDNVQVLKSSP